MLKLYSWTTGLGVLALLFSASLQAQSQSTVYQQWTALPEDPVKHTEVDYTVVDCSGNATLLLRIFNENGAAKSVSLTITLTSGSTTATHTISGMNMAGGSTAIGDCQSSGTDLRFLFPSGMDPTTTTVSITYN